MNADDVELTLPARSPDAIDSVLVVDFPAQIATNRALRLATDASTALHVMDGRLDGSGIRYGDGKTYRDVTDEWSKLDGTVTWTIRVPQTSRFKVAAQYNTLTKDDSGTFAIEVAQQQLTGKVTPTDDQRTFRSDALGEVALTAGEHTLVVRARQIDGTNLMRLRQLEITPVNESK